METTDDAIERMMKGAPRAGELDLSIGEPDGGLPPFLLDVAVRSLTEGRTTYTPKLGLGELRVAIADDIAASTGTRPAVDDVIVTIGGSEAVAVAIEVATAGGGGMLLPDPAWPNYRVLAAELGIPVQTYRQGPSGDAFLDLDEIEGLLRRSPTRLVVVNSPSNPTAAVASAAVLADLVELVRRYDAYILSDEAYESIVFSGGRAASPLTVGADRTFSARTFSKTYSMTGLRVGSLVSPSSFRVPVAAVHGSTVGAAPTTAQDVALAALRSMPGRSDEVAAVYRERFELAAEVLGPWNPNPDIRSLGGFYLWVGSLTSGRLSASQGRPVHGGREIAGELRHEGILVSMGEVYSPTATGFIRIALTAPAHVLRPAIEVVRETLES